MNIINTNGALPLSGYNPYTHTAKTSRSAQQDTFSIGELTDTQNKTDKVSLSTAGIQASDDAVDPPIPEGGVPSWLTAHYIRAPDIIGAPANWTYPENLKFSNLSSGECTEYFSLLDAHIHSLYERHGLTDEKSINAALNSKSANEKLHQAFLEGIKADPRMLEFVTKLGIRPS
ncbi:hypothetical protein ACW9IK_18450 [Pseudomonas gingeri]|uniref:hypothetical protein n=1 Tax=Pseudomonas sp. Mn2068 TaxID=3395265 RepID=UPI003BD10183